MMKKLIYTLLTLSLLTLAYSCSKEDEKKIEPKPKTTIPAGWSENADFEVLSKPSWFLHRSGKDSIYVSMYHNSKLQPNLMYVRHYEKNENGKYRIKSDAKMEDVYSIQKGLDTQMYGILGDREYGINYNKKNDSTVVFYNLPKIGEFEEGKAFDGVSRKGWNEKNSLVGGWYHSEVVDSTVLVFERNNIKEYLFIRTSSTIIDSWEIGDYTVERWEDKLGEEILSMTRTMTLEEGDYNEKYKGFPYSLNADRTKLTIYWQSPEKTITYTRIKK